MPQRTFMMALAQVSRIFRSPKPPKHYLERQKYTVIIPWHTRLLGPVPWTRSEAQAFPSNKAKMALAGILVALAAVGALGYRIADRNSAAVAFTRGGDAIHSWDFDKTIAFLEESRRNDPSNALAFFELGNAYYLAGDNAAAIAAWTEALRIKPDLSQADLAIRSVRDADFGKVSAP